jgi:hypothetical protein
MTTLMEEVGSSVAWCGVVDLCRDTGRDEAIQTDGWVVKMRCFRYSMLDARCLMLDA